MYSYTRGKSVTLGDQGIVGRSERQQMSHILAYTPISLRKQNISRDHVLRECPTAHQSRPFPALLCSARSTGLSSIITEFPCNGNQNTASNERLRGLLAYSKPTKLAPSHFPKREPELETKLERASRLFSNKRRANRRPRPQPTHLLPSFCLFFSFSTGASSAIRTALLSLLAHRLGTRCTSITRARFLYSGVTCSGSGFLPSSGKSSSSLTPGAATKRAL